MKHAPLHFDELAHALEAAWHVWFWAVQFGEVDEGATVELYATPKRGGRCRATSLDGTGLDWPE